MADQSQNDSLDGEHNINGISDSQILKMIDAGHPGVLELIYDKYASLIYGVVIDMIPDREIADEILREIFLQIKEGRVDISSETPLWIVLLLQSHFIANTYIAVNGLSSQMAKSGRYKKCPLLRLLFYECLSLKEAANKVGIAESAVKKQIHDEFSLLFTSLKDAIVS